MEISCSSSIGENFASFSCARVLNKSRDFSAASGSVAIGPSFTCNLIIFGSEIFRAFSLRYEMTLDELKSWRNCYLEFGLSVLIIYHWKLLWKFCGQDQLNCLYSKVSDVWWKMTEVIRKWPGLDVGWNHLTYIRFMDWEEWLTEWLYSEIKYDCEYNRNNRL